MKMGTFIALGIGLAASLAAAPARADLAGTDSGPGELLTLQSLVSVLDAAATIPPGTTLSAQLVSSGPDGLPIIPFGVDSANIPPATGLVAAAINSTGAFVSGASSGSASLLSLAAALPVETGHPVAAPAPPATDLSSMSGSLSAPVSSLAAGGGEPVTPTPIPAPFLMLGSGLIALLPLRRFTESPSRT